MKEASSDEVKETVRPRCAGVRGFVIKQWFLLGMVFAIILAAIVPSLGKKNGVLHPEIGVKYVLVPLIFFCSGLTLQRKKLTQALLYCKLNVLIQCYNLMFYPAVTFCESLALRGVMSQSLTDGLIIMGCVPTTVSMCFILSNSCGSNSAIAVINATIGNMMGIFVTPALLLLLLSSESSINVWKVMQKLLLTLLLPLCVGQMVQCAFGLVRPQVKKYLGYMNKIILMVIVFVSFCDTFSSNADLSAGSLVGLIALVITTYLFLLSVSYCVFSIPFLGIKALDKPPAWFCSTQKTVAMGLPLINIIFEGREDIGIIAIPLLIVHPTQLLVGTLLIPSIERWLAKQPKEEGQLGEGGEEVALVKRLTDEKEMSSLVPDVALEAAGEEVTV